MNRWFIIRNSNWHIWALPSVLLNFNIRICALLRHWRTSLISSSSIKIWNHRNLINRSIYLWIFIMNWSFWSFWKYSFNNMQPITYWWKGRIKIFLQLLSYFWRTIWIIHLNANRSLFIFVIGSLLCI